MMTCKRLFALIMCLITVNIYLPAYAAGRIDLNREVGLTISYQDGDMPLSGAEFCLYLTAKVDASGELTAEEAFSRFNLDIRGKNDDAWWTLASTLEGYVLQNQIEPTDRAVTDSMGMASFPSEGKKLVPGLYLVLGKRLEQDGRRYDAAPFMVMLPSQDEEKNEWIYQVTVNAKHESEEIPDEPKPLTCRVQKVWDDEGHEKERPREVIIQLLCNDTVYDTVSLNADNNWRYLWTDLDSSFRWTVAEELSDSYETSIERENGTFVVTNTFHENKSNPPEGPVDPDTPASPSLPQTGQLWWPVPVLVAAGLLFVVVGFIRRRGNKHE